MQMEGALRPGPRADLDAWLHALSMLEASLDYLEDNAELAACAEVGLTKLTICADVCPILSVIPRNNAHAIHVNGPIGLFSCSTWRAHLVDVRH